MKVSIIIPTYNEESVIKNCVDSLLSQSYKDIEIIIVDDGSTDNTKQIIKDLNLSKKKIALLNQSHKGPGAARNFGAKKANGEILVFVDSDMTFEKNFVGDLIKPIIQGKLKGTFSKDERVSNEDNIWSRCWGINEGWEKGRRHNKNHPDKQKVFRAILKSEFEKVGGFDLTGYTDDWTLSDKLGYEAVNANATFYHKNPSTLKEVLQQAEWIGKRNYKFGNLGKIVSLIRSSLPVSIVVGLTKSVLNNEPRFLVFKLVYDFGIFAGTLETLMGGSNAK